MRSVTRYATVLALGSMLLMSAGASRGEQQSKRESRKKMDGSKVASMTVKSLAFSANETIPVKYTCDGPDLSPPLQWSQAPKGSESLALICEDPDAPVGLWVHWVVWGLPPDSTALPEAVTNGRILSTEARQGKNDFGNIGYGGPCPPPGKPHRYYFKLYALNVKLDLGPGATRKELLKAMEGHIIGLGELMGRYGRPKQ
jgi:Raf kinase inhibitor-like YbhB/YbcL family protein